MLLESPNGDVNSATKYQITEAIWWGIHWHTLERDLFSVHFNVELLLLFPATGTDMKKSANWIKKHQPDSSLTSINLISMIETISCNILLKYSVNTICVKLNIGCLCSNSQKYFTLCFSDAGTNPDKSPLYPFLNLQQSNSYMQDKRDLQMWLLQEEVL